MAWLLTLIPVGIAVIGLFGVLAAAIITARSATRSRLYEANDRRAKQFTEFQVRTASAVNDILITSSVIVDDFEIRKAEAKQQALKQNQTQYNVETVTPELRERNAKTTAAWRAVLAESHLYPETELQRALSDFDNARDEFVKAVASADMSLARTKLQSLNVKPVYNQLQLTRLQHDAILLHTLGTRWLRRGLKTALKQSNKVATDLRNRINQS